MKVCKKSIKEVTNMLKERGLSQPKQAKIFGVTPLTIHNYQQGNTLSPGIEVVKRVFDNITFEGKPVLIDTFNSYEEFITTWELHEKGKVNETF